MAVSASKGARDGSADLLGQSAEYVEELYATWRQDPGAVPESWRAFFAGYELGQAGAPGSAEGHAQSKLASLIYAYRSQGHWMAHVNPIAPPPGDHPALALEAFGFTEADLPRVFDTGHLPGPPRATLGEILTQLRETYCRSVGVEYVHIQDREVRRWLQAQMEPGRNRPAFPRARRLQILEDLTDATAFERFTHSRYPGQKRFSVEGAETLIPALRALIELAAELGVGEVVVGMAHRGRLNVLANVLGMPHELIFSEFEGNFLPDSVHGDGDVKYHKGYGSEVRTQTGRAVHLSLTANPSHLEAVSPVVEGRVRAKQRQKGDTETRRAVLPLLIHGDAAFAGQGIVAETLNLSLLPGYRTGGTVHLVIDNQIGFTTLPGEARSTCYATDVAKMIEAPIFHVNGEDPEAMVFATELALRFRQTFGRDVVVDLVCYRRHGHNEGDDPTYTQPVMYARIAERPPVAELYRQQLVAAGELGAAEAEELALDYRARLEQAHELVKRTRTQFRPRTFEEHWQGLDAPFSFAPTDTGVPRELLGEVGRALTAAPADFHLNPKIARRLEAQRKALEGDGSVDWAFAEALAFGTLLAEGTPVRLSGQDSARGTFSQRHAVWQDVTSQAPFVPLNHLREGQARFCVYNSSLSEAAVLAFEYGYALSEPRMLILWEAQFGDFANGAQVIVDQFITGAESKWERDNGLVLLLPHGYEGQGPEHSSAYLERYLQATADHNIQVCYPTTPAQYFHLLRRQVRRPFRLPLVVMTPKSMLRRKEAVSALGELADGRFQEVLDDTRDPRSVRRIVLCTGKLFWELREACERQGREDVALVRLEQLYPLHEERLTAALGRYPAATELTWAQEEPENRGAWSYIFPILLRLAPGLRLAYAGRRRSASSATGSLKAHEHEQQQVLEAALARAEARDLRMANRSTGS
ncbi:MAG: 2-oxoglutarate dehydrogenase E1 component [Deltaproteobacteria bacterium]|nr:2-oxoglutarate dehydrogenase E1 component [Deltaproteobacteria bacterium]